MNTAKRQTSFTAKKSVCEIHGNKFQARSGCRYCKKPKGRQSFLRHANTLVTDLWNFIENVTDEDPARTDKFFALRNRVRMYYAHAGKRLRLRRSTD